MKNLLFLTIFFTLFLQTTCVFSQSAVPCDEPGYEVEGTFANSSSTAPVVKDMFGPNIKVGDKGDLSSLVEQNFFGRQSTVWLGIGKVQVTQVKPGEVTFRSWKKRPKL